MNKSKLAVERDKFLESKEGQSLCEGVTSGQYLYNRIERAFLAGVQVGLTLRLVEISAADIRVFLAENLPYYEAEDKDNFLYIAKASDIERVARVLYRHLTPNHAKGD